MSTESQTDYDHDSQAEPAPPKSRRKFWILGGCGCFVFILLACCGGLMLYSYQQVSNFQNEQIGFAESSMRVEELIGSDPLVDRSSVVQSQQKIEGEGSPTFNDAMSGNYQFEFRYNIEGTDGKGVLGFTAKPSSSGLERSSIYLEVDGVKHNLNPEEEFDLDIDEGFDFEDDDMEEDQEDATDDGA